MEKEPHFIDFHCFIPKKLNSFALKKRSKNKAENRGKVNSLKQNRCFYSVNMRTKVYHTGTKMLHKNWKHFSKILLKLCNFFFLSFLFFSFFQFPFNFNFVISVPIAIFLHFQIAQCAERGLFKKVGRWFSDAWNKMDAFTIILFFVAFWLRSLEEYRMLGHAVYAVDIMLWIYRLLDTFKISKNLGPIVVMIRQMVRFYYCC